jgi:hypothetical protein
LPACSGSVSRRKMVSIVRAPTQRILEVMIRK